MSLRGSAWRPLEGRPDDYVHPSAESQPSPTPSVDRLEQLMKLGELRDAGILTAEELEAKKAQILGRM